MRHPSAGTLTPFYSQLSPRLGLRWLLLGSLSRQAMLALYSEALRPSLGRYWALQGGALVATLSFELRQPALPYYFQ